MLKLFIFLMNTISIVTIEGGQQGGAESSEEGSQEIYNIIIKKN